MAAIRGILVKQFGGPDVLEYVNDISRPSEPVGSQILVRVKSAGVNPVDTYVRSGSYQRLPSLPYCPGYDGAGIVEAIGKEVTKFQVGDRVYWCRCVDGSYKELTLTDEMYTFPLHDTLSFQQGAAIGIPYLTAYRALVTKARLKAGETVLVHGASGAVGIASCQTAKHLGAVVIGTAGTEAGMQAVLQNGASTVANHREPGYTDKIKTDKGIDVIVENLANVNIDKDIELAGLDGRIAVVGCRGKAEIALRAAMLKEVSVQGIYLGKSSQSDYSEMGAFMSQGQADGWLRPLIGQEYPLQQAADAHVEVMAHRISVSGKIVLNT